jgi:uncharacterized membrane protein
VQNVHPLFVHFPIAFLFSAAVAELAHALWRRPDLDALSRWLLYLGSLTTAAAALTGWIAGQTAAPVAAAREALEDHRTLAFVTLGVAAALALWRWGMARRGGPRPRLLFTAAMVGMAALLVAAAQEGGELVHEHGVGTRLTAPGGPLHEAPGRPAPGAKTPDVPRGSDFR